MPYVKTPTNGAVNFPANENEAYGFIETLAYQNIRSVKSANRLDDAFYFIDLTEENGVVLEMGLIDKAQKQTYAKDDCSKSPVDPKTVARYFNNWEKSTYQVTVRRDEIRKIIANKGQGVEDIVAEILDTLTQGKDADEFAAGRSLLRNAEVYDYADTLDGTPANLRGIIYAIRDMYDTIREDNAGFDITGWKTHAPEADIRIAITPKLLNLMDVGELANILNLSKVELMGKLVVVPASDLPASEWYKVTVYDRKAMVHARRIMNMDNEKCVRSQFWNYYLFLEDLWSYNPLFKAVQYDFTATATAERDKLITPPAEPPAEQNTDNNSYIGDHRTGEPNTVDEDDAEEDQEN